MKVVPADESHIRWAMEEINGKYTGNEKGISSISDEGELYCCCLLGPWTESCCQGHIAIKNPIGLKNYTFLKEIFKYVFITSDRLTMLGFVPADNEKAVRFDKKIGFEEIARIPDGAKAGVDTLVMVLRRDKCKWIGVNNG